MAVARRVGVQRETGAGKLLGDFFGAARLAVAVVGRRVHKAYANVGARVLHCDRAAGVLGQAARVRERHPLSAALGAVGVVAEARPAAVVHFVGVREVRGIREVGVGESLVVDGDIGVALGNIGGSLDMSGLLYVGCLLDDVVVLSVGKGVGGEIHLLLGADLNINRGGRLRSVQLVVLSRTVVLRTIALPTGTVPLSPANEAVRLRDSGALDIQGPTVRVDAAEVILLNTFRQPGSFLRCRGNRTCCGCGGKIRTHSVWQGQSWVGE